jgi:hypothetical protein
MRVLSDAIAVLLASYSVDSVAERSRFASSATFSRALFLATRSAFCCRSVLMSKAIVHSFLHCVVVGLSAAAHCHRAACGAGCGALAPKKKGSALAEPLNENTFKLV